MFEAFHCSVKNKLRFHANYCEKGLKLVVCIDNVNVEMFI